MFSPAVGRVARSANFFSAAPASCLARTALSTAPQQPFRPTHQRRLSSSKPSIPPSSKKKPAEIDQNATAELQGSGKRSEDSQKKLKEPSTATLGNNVPFVPPTNHLRERDVKLSAFFALHRPLSISKSLPDATSVEVFDALFDVGRSNDPQTVQSTANLLEGFLQRMHAEIDAQEEHQADALDSSEDVYFLDVLSTQQGLERYTSGMIPFMPPAPPMPQPHDPLATGRDPVTYSLGQLASVVGQRNQRATEVDLPSSQAQAPTTFREHVARRRFGMFLISVKRQRKLKMKKHKYKKLMKRTRLLRRKLDRL